MSSFLQQLKWQFLLLQRNSIIIISFVVTIVYGLLLYFLNDVKYIDELLISLVLNDPSVIGYFFIALAIYTEIKQGVLNALIVTPTNCHHYLISKIIALSVIGTICSILLVLSVKGLNFDYINYTIGSFSICLLSSTIGVIVLTFASEFLNFALLSIPVFFLFTGISLLAYLGTIDIGLFKYFLPVQAGLDLIENAVNGKPINYWYISISLCIAFAFFYAIAFRLFNKKYLIQ